MRKEYSGTTNTDAFARQLLQYPYFTAPDLVEYLDVSRRTAYKVVDDLESDGLIEEVTGKERGKEYKSSRSIRHTSIRAGFSRATVRRETFKR